jgi:glycosyltransferase involved in cell wall biosynthesis
MGGLRQDQHPDRLGTSPKAGGRTYRLAVLNTHPIQYFAPLYRRLACESDIDLTVYYCSRQGLERGLDRGFGREIAWDISLVDGYKCQFLPNLRKGGRAGQGFFQLANPHIITELYRARFDAIWLHAYNYFTSMAAFVAARLLGIPIFYRTESSLIYDQRVARPFWLGIAKMAFLRIYLSQIDRCLAIGSRNRQFFQYYGRSPATIDDVPYTVDNLFFQREAGIWEPRRQSLRQTLGLPSTAVIFIFVAKLIQEKRPLELIKAYSRLNAGDRAALVIAGDGILAPECKRYVAQAGLKNIVFTGFVNQSELPKYYALSDVLVHAADPCKGDWGLTVNEAMACGLAIIASEGVGAAIDLVKERGTGLMIPCGSISALAAAMERLLDRLVCDQMRSASKRVIAGWDYERCVRGIKRALSQTVPA